MAPRLLGQTSLFGGVFYVFKSLGHCETEELLKNYNFDPKASDPS